jgi:hypothetical protein
MRDAYNFKLHEHLADYALRTLDLFTTYVDGQMRKHEVDEPLIWRLRGFGYAEYPIAQVDAIIKDCAARRNLTLADEWFQRFPDDH